MIQTAVRTDRNVTARLSLITIPGGSDIQYGRSLPPPDPFLLAGNADRAAANPDLDKIDAATAPKPPTAPKPLAEKPVDTAAAEEEALRAVQKVFYGQRLEANKRYHEQIIQNAKEAAEEELKVAEAAAKERQKIDDQIAREGGEELMNAFLDRDKQMQDARDATAKAEMDAQRSATMELTQLSGSLAMALGSATAATFQGIEGQKAAFESLVSSASQAIGGYIMMKGGQVLAEGIASELALPGNPLGIAQIAGGTGLIAAGAAIPCCLMTDANTSRPTWPRTPS